MHNGINVLYKLCNPSTQVYYVTYIQVHYVDYRIIKVYCADHVTMQEYYVDQASMQVYILIDQVM